MICAERVKSFRFLAVFSDFERREKRLCFYNKGNPLLFFGSHQSQSVSQYYTRVLKTHRDTQKESFCFFQKICRITGRGVALFFQKKISSFSSLQKKKTKSRSLLLFGTRQQQQRRASACTLSAFSLCIEGGVCCCF